MTLAYKKADISDLEQLTETRVMVLRSANKLSDEADLSLVEKESYSYYQKCFDDDSHVAYLVYDGQKIVGTGGISFYKVMPTYHNPSGQKAYIMNMFTSPEYRRQGIAFETLRLLVFEAVDRKISHISLEATEMGRPLYEKFGFVEAQNEMILPEC